jgi:NAD(P)-dependent dehydrogenase (short-subunit alcohol dehydrogenase family)
MSSQHAVIVGGTSGIGQATAQALLAAGGRVTVTGRNEARLAQARRVLGPEAQVLQMDAAAADALPAQFAEIGGFDHLVLALGSGRGLGPLAGIDLADVRRGFEEKVFAHFAAAKAALPHLNKAGSITFISAVSAHAAAPGTAGIGAANAAVAALVPILAVELAPRRVNAVSPGVIDTPWWDVMPKAQKQAIFEQYAAKTPVGRIGTAEDVAGAIAFLIGNGFVNGQVLICDGGLRLAA